MSSKYMDIATVATNVVVGNQTIALRNGFGTPTAAIFYLFKTTGVSDPGLGFGVGVTDGVNEFACSLSSQNGVSAVNADHIRESSAIVLLENGVIVARGTLQSFGVDQIVVNWTVAPTQAWTLMVVAFTGTLNADVRSYSHLLTDSAVKTQAVGFRPDLFFMIGTPDGLVGVQSDAGLSIGMGDTGAGLGSSASRQSSVRFYDRDGAIKTEVSMIAQSGVIYGIHNGAGEIVRVSVDPSFSSTAWESRLDLTNADAHWYGLTMKFPADGQLSFAEYVSRSNIGPQTLINGGVDPLAALVLSTDIDSVQENALVTNGAAGTMGIGAAVDYQGTPIYMGGYFRDEDLATNTNNETGFDASALIKREKDDGSADSDATVASFDASGMTIGYTTNHVSNALFWVLYQAGSIADGPNDVMMENRHAIESGLKTQTAAGMTGVLIE